MPQKCLPNKGTPGYNSVSNWLGEPLRAAEKGFDPDPVT